MRFSYKHWGSVIALAAIMLSAGAAPPAAPAPAADDQPAAEAAAPEGMMTEIGAGEGQLDIVAWPGYIERGETDPNYDWVTKFEEETGCKVNIKSAGTSDEMVTLMNQGGFDLVTASGDASNRLIAGGTVQPVNLDLIPSYANVDERLKGAPWYNVDGKAYGVPYQWGPNVLMYRTDVFSEPPTSWQVVFEAMDLPDGQPNKGRVQAYDGPIYVADAALYLKTHNPDLGISDPYALTQEQFDAAVELLRGQRELVSRYWHDVVVQMEDFKNEGVVASSAWPFQVNLLVAEGAPIASTFPSEGATGWADTTLLHSEAAHPNCAYLWMEHSLSPKVQGDVAAWFGSVPVVPDACTGNELLTDSGCTTNGFDDFDKISFWRTPTTKCADGSDACIPYSTWVETYIGIMGGN